MKNRFPKKGEWVAVKTDTEYIHGYKINVFVGMEGNKVVCSSTKSNKLRHADYYQIIEGDNHPLEDFWFNSGGENVPYKEIVANNMFETKEWNG